MTGIRARITRLNSVGVIAASVLLVVLSTRANAQQRASSVLAPRVSENTRDDGTIGWHLDQCIGGLTYGAPLKLALSYGGGMLLEQTEGPDICALAVAKLGVGGAQASFGAGSTIGSLGSGVMITANVLRTFGAPLNASAHRTYVGASVHLWPILALGGELGLYVRMGDASGAQKQGKHVVSWSAGFGF